MDLLEAADAAPAHRHPWETARLWVLRRLLRAHVPLNATPVIVDVGCGDAFVIGELAREFPGAQCYGVDAAFDAEAARRRQQQLPPNVRLFQRLDDVPSERPAAVILLMDVIEHIEDDRGFLRDLQSRPFSTDGTAYVVTVPAYQWLFSAHDTFLRHYRRYSTQQLCARLEECGLRVVTSGHFFASLLPIRVLQAARERIMPAAKAGATGLSEYSAGASKTAIMRGILIADAAIALFFRRVGIVIPGLSSYAVCRKFA